MSVNTLNTDIGSFFILSICTIVDYNVYPESKLQTIRLR